MQKYQKNPKLHSIICPAGTAKVGCKKMKNITQYDPHVNFV